LADIGGVPMIVRVWRRAVEADVGPVAVAAGDPEIVDAIEAVGGMAVLTDPKLSSGSDRILQALARLDSEARHDVVMNLQGDMPFVSPSVLVACAGLLKARAPCDIATAVAPETGLADRSNPDVVKAVLALEPGGRAGRALYFTRSTLWGEGPIWRHVGLYGYRREALAVFSAAPPSPLERRENLEQLRALELGLEIHAAVVDVAPISVDTPADLAQARAHAQDQGR
jgi:3-deoxy-manno-octulosonate cytidylyltransferase (CMP-KDO synthetase)